MGKTIVANPNVGAQFNGDANSVLDEFARKAQSDFLATEQTWETHNTEFVIESFHSGAAIGRNIYTTNEIYYYLNNGTRVRRVLLVGAGKGKHGNSSVGKTRVRVLGSEGGSKVGIIISKKFEFKGIDAREWDKMIADKYRAEFVAAMQKLAFDSARVRTR